MSDNDTLSQGTDSLAPVQVSFETAHPVTAARPVMFGDELQAEPHPGIPGLEVIVYYAGDGALVVQIDTKEIDMISWRGRLRVNLNDDQIYDGDPDTDTPCRRSFSRGQAGAKAEAPRERWQQPRKRLQR